MLSQFDDGNYERFVSALVIVKGSAISWASATKSGENQRYLKVPGSVCYDLYGHLLFLRNYEQNDLLP